MLSVPLYEKDANVVDEAEDTTRELSSLHRVCQPWRLTWCRPDYSALRSALRIASDGQKWSVRSCSMILLVAVR